MYLILKTYANCDMEDAALTSCAVVEASTTLLERLTTWMDKAASVSADLGKDVTLAWMNYSPDCYQGFPDHDDFAEEDLDPGWCLMDSRPFPESDEGYALAEPGIEWFAPVPLSYCELRVSAKEVSWWYGPKYGSVEEYTVALTRMDLAEIAALGENVTQA